jgi:hypothetical protein
VQATYRDVCGKSHTNLYTLAQFGTFLAGGVNFKDCSGT